MPYSGAFHLAIERFDAENAQDPNGEELIYAQRMTTWLARLDPDANEILQLAVRAQHLRRWEIPRNRFPMDRAGYHRWREQLAHFHADAAGKILNELQYPTATVERVKSIILKQNLKSDAEAQTLEDVACLVFIEFEFPDFLNKQSQEKIHRILRRTWAKMSPRGHAAAMQLLPSLPTGARTALEQAIRMRKD